MNYLQLVQKTARQSGTLAGAASIASVAGLTGRGEKIANWVADAWTDIQNQRDHWNFLRAEFSSTLAVGTKRYTAASFNLTRHASWMVDSPAYQPVTIYDTDIGQSDETSLKFVSFDRWRTRWDRGSIDNARPTEYSVSPAGELCFGGPPDKAYAVRGEYVKSAQTLSGNTDTPEAPSRFHDIIVYRAMILMGGSDESPITMQVADREYNRLFRALCNDQLPALEIAG